MSDVSIVEHLETGGIEHNGTGRDIMIVDEEQRDTEDMLNRFYFSARDTLIQNEMWNSSKPFNLEDYDHIMSTFNSTEMNFTMKSCSLSKELDNVSNDNLMNSRTVVK